MKAIIVSSILLSMSSLSAIAGQIIIDDNKNIIKIEGNIDEYTYEMFAGRDISKLPKEIYLNSPGGHPIIGMKLGKLIRENSMNTNVEKGSRCESACTFLFQGGIKRKAYNKSLGYHLASYHYWIQPSFNERTLDFIHVKKVNEEIKKFYTDYGVKQEFIDYLAYEMVYPNTNQMTYYGLTN